MAAYGLISNLTLMFLGNALGRMVDTLPRDKMVTLAVITQNLAVSLTCLIMSIYFSVGLHISLPLYCTVLCCTVLYCTADLTTQGKVELTPSLTLWVSVIVLLLSPASFLSSVAGRTSVEKDWIVIMCEGDTAKLARVNTNLRTIDHFCNLLAPLLAGQILTYSSYFAAALILMVWVRFAD